MELFEKAMIIYDGNLFLNPDQSITFHAPVRSYFENERRPTKGCVAMMSKGNVGTSIKALGGLLPVQQWIIPRRNNTNAIRSIIDNAPTQGM